MCRRRSSAMSRRRAACDDGAAVVEFVLVSVVLTALFLAVVQLALTLHVRNTLVASAAEGARYGANADRTPEEGAAYAAQIVEQALWGAHSDDVTAGYEDVLGNTTVYVEIRTDVPVIGFFGFVPELIVRGHAMEEAQ